VKRRIKCFAAIKPANAIIKRLAREIGFLQLAGAPIRWVAPENIHLTVKFIGELEPDEVIPVIESMEDALAEIPRHRLELRGIVTLPKEKAPRIVAASVGGDTASYEAMFKGLQQSLGELGFRPDRKGLVPHLTLGRVKGVCNDDLVDRIDRSRSRAFGVMDVTTIDLMMSDKGPRGTTEYNSMKSFHLG